MFSHLAERILIQQLCHRDTLIYRRMVRSMWKRGERDKYMLNERYSESSSVSHLLVLEANTIAAVDCQILFLVN